MVSNVMSASYSVLQYLIEVPVSLDDEYIRVPLSSFKQYESDKMLAEFCASSEMWFKCLETCSEKPSENCNRRSFTGVSQDADNSPSRS